MARKRTELAEEAGTRLGILRSALDFKTVRAFAKELDVKEDRYAAWESGKAVIPPHMVERLRAKWGVSADWIYFGVGLAMPNELYKKISDIA